MANLKISQLPEYTGSMANTWTVLNNSGQTATYKVDRENWLSGYATSADLTAVSSSVATTDLGQNNRLNSIESVTGSYAISSSVASTITALSSSIATTDLGQNNRLTTIEGRYATTGSNIFKGDQTITGSIIVSGSNFSIQSSGLAVITSQLEANINSPVSINLTSPVTVISGSNGLTVRGNQTLSGSLNIRSTSGTAIDTNQGLIFAQTISSNDQLNLYSGGNSNINLQAAGTGSIVLNNNTNINSNATISGSVKIQNVAGNAIEVNGGNVRVSGSISINASAPTGTRFLFFTHPSGSSWGANISYNPTIGSSGSLTISNGIGGQIVIGSTSGSNFIQGNTKITGSAHSITGSLGVSGNVQITGSINTIGSLTNSGSFIQTGSVITTGSVQGNIKALTVSGFNTASMNLDDANFFTLQLVSGSAVHLLPSNIKPGQTVNVLVNTIGSGSITFPNTVRQISGSLYIPTYATGQDILTMVSFDSSSLYLANAKNFL